MYSGCCDKTIEDEYGEISLHKIAIRNMLFRRKINPETYCEKMSGHEFHSCFEDGSPSCYCGKKQNYDFDWYKDLKEMNT